MSDPTGGQSDLSDQQSRPLTVRGASVALSAGAGCGKTTVLTARFLGDLDAPDRRPLSSLIALTFTDKAARELRQRIRRDCRRKLVEAGDDAARWRGVLRGLEAAPIGTFHEFCGRWLRRHADAAGIDPDFAILDASIASTVRDEALAKCLRERLARKDPDLIDLAVEFGLRSVREALADLVSNRATGDLAAWVGREPDAIIADWEKLWHDRGSAASLRKVEAAAQSCIRLLSAHDCSHPKMRERRAFLLEHLPEVKGGTVSDDWLGTVREQAMMRGGGTSAHWPSPEIHEAVSSCFKALREAIADFIKKCQWDADATREAAEHGLRYARLALAAREAYDDAKRARGGLDFDDLLLKTRDLLRDHAEEVRNSPEGAIERVLVDEFQDTDRVQSEILRSLTGEGFGAGRLFIVGDSKQSIYRFRGAQPAIFDDFRTQFPAEGSHSLTENYRSVPGILDFINALFASTFTAPNTALVPGPKPVERHDRPTVEFLWAVEPGGDPGHAHDRRKAEARWLARRIRERLAAGWMIRDGKTQPPRKAHAGDIAFLFRAMTDVGPYESALDEEGLDYHIIGGSSFYAQQEVHDLINLLSAIEDPLDAIALTGALRSPFFCLSDDGLFWLATAWRDLVEGLERASEIDELSERDRGHAVRARGLLARWRGLKDRLSIAALVDLILDESGYEAALPGEWLGARKRANARKLVRLARRFDRQGGFTLAAFVRRLRADVKRPPKEEQAATTDEEGRSLRLMSIHQAKGLEFPIVVLPDLNRQPPGAFDSVAFHPDLGPLVRPPREPGAESGPSDDEPAGNGSRRSLGWMTYQAIEQYEEERESLRLFYVATTRARDHLILSAGAGPTEKPKSPALALLDARFDRATGGLRDPLPDGWHPPVVRVTTECPPPGLRPTPVRLRYPPLIEIAEVIERAPAQEVAAIPARVRLPRFVTLDPASGLAPTPARLDRLVRVLLADPRAWRAKDLPRVASEVAGRHDPLMAVRLIDEAVARLLPWIDGPVGRAIAADARCGRKVDWSLAWPPEGADATVFRGTIDVVYRDREGRGCVVVVGDSGASEAREHLRLLLSAHAAESFGLGPIRQGWRVRLGPAGGVLREDDFRPTAIHAAVRSAFGSDP